MNSGPARWALAHLNAWTWLVAEYRIWVIVIASVIGIAAPLLSASAPISGRSCGKKYKDQPPRTRRNRDPATP